MKKSIILMMMIFMLLFICLTGCPNTTETTTTTIPAGTVQWMTQYLSSLTVRDEPYDIELTESSPDLEAIQKLFDKHYKLHINLDLSKCTGLKTIGESTFSNLMSSSTVLKSIILPDSVTSIEQSAFNMCKGLESVTLGNSVKIIGKSAFSNCINLSNIIIPDSVTSIEESAFRGCSSLNSIIIPDGVKSIGEGAFLCQNLESIILSDNLYSSNIASGAFGTGATGCEAIVYNSHTFFYMNNSYWGDYTIPSTIKTIAKAAFYNCKNLFSVVIPDSVTEIEYGAFKSCHNLASVSFGNNLKFIGENAFAYCKKLTRITLPESVTRIYKEAFFQCPELKTIYINAVNPPIIGENEQSWTYFLGYRDYNSNGGIDWHWYYTGTSIYVPSASLQKYKTSENWQLYTDIIYAM